MNNTQSVTVTLGDLQDQVDARLQSGAYESVDEVLRAGIRALAREEAATQTMLRRKVEEALNDPRPPIPAKKVFQEIRAHHVERMKASRRGV